MNLIIQDSWKLFHIIEQKGEVNSFILNAMLSIHAKALKIEELEGLVLPLFDKFAIKKTEYTYECLIELYKQQKNMEVVNRLFRDLKKQGIEPGYNIINDVLDCAVR